MSQYMLLIYRPVDGPPAGQPEPPMEAWFEYTRSLQDAGALLHSAPLQSVESATTVRARDGETQLTALSRQLGDFQLAEDALQDAFAAAVATWSRDGVPASPGAWLMTTARRRAIDRLRRNRSLADRAARLAEPTRISASAHEETED